MLTCKGGGPKEGKLDLKGGIGFPSQCDNIGKELGCWGCIQRSDYDWSENLNIERIGTRGGEGKWLLVRAVYLSFPGSCRVDGVGMEAVFGNRVRE